MLAGVHSETAGNALRQCVPVKESPVGFCSDDWDNTLDQHPDFAADLNYLAESVVSIQAFARAFIDCHSHFQDTQASALVAAVLNIEQKLIDWENSVPDAWPPRQTGDLFPANLSAFQAYGTTMDIYDNVWIANTYNSFGMLRILLQALTHDMMCSYPQVRSTIFPSGPLADSHTMQRLFDGFCASAPFFVGNSATGVQPAAVIFPAAQSSVPSLSYYPFALRVSPQLLQAPLNICATYKSILLRQWV